MNFVDRMKQLSDVISVYIRKLGKLHLKVSNGLVTLGAEFKRLIVVGERRGNDGGGMSVEGYSCTQLVFQILKRDHWLIRTAASYLVCGNPEAVNENSKDDDAGKRRPPAAVFGLTPLELPDVWAPVRSGNHYVTTSGQPFVVLIEVCEIYKLPLTQTWVPCRHRGVLAYGGDQKKNYSSFDGSCMEQVCMSVSDAAFYIVDADMWGFHEAYAEHHLQKG
ncbi:hypothetical protein Nepgr_029638 [Nepenthes gracilis]|uniref:NLP1-9 GAF domain-containing protein n=1 Tax=Nepenthes gracilis TaxID=150966 RepID=A0AAD3Y513_NEPGR|nr:hypothetical protein Nepgr_029638 [Nepenthes gracilis]